MTTISSESLEKGMRVQTPQYMRDSDTGRQFDLRKKYPRLPDELIVRLWDRDDGESFLEAPDGSIGIDFSTADYPEAFELVGPHGGDPILADAQDVGHDLKIQDPGDCEMYAWGAPWRTPGANEEEGLWVWLVFCRPGFEDAPIELDGSGEAVWHYDVFLVKGENESDPVDEVVEVDWPRARQAIQDFRRRAGLFPRSEAWDVLNRHRGALGLPPLDPGAGWTDEEVVQEVERLRATGLLRTNPMRAVALKRRLLR